MADWEKTAKKGGGGKKSEILLNILHEAQGKEGYLSEKTLKRISDEQGIPMARLYGVVKFYTMFYTEPQGKNIIEICGSPSCVLNNGVALEKQLEAELGVKIGETTADRLFSLYKVSCIGCCDEAPAMLVNRKPCTKLTAQRLSKLIAGLREKSIGGKGAKKGKYGKVAKK